MANEIQLAVIARDKASATLRNVRNEATGLQGAVNGLTGPMQTLQRNWQPIALAAAGATAAIGGAIVTAKQFVDVAASTNEALNKNRVIFGEHSDAVVAFSERAASAVGLSQREALAATGVFGNLFTTMGLGSQQAGQMSTDLVTLSADLSSFHDLAGGAAEAADLLRAGLVGEAEPMRRLGVLINAAAVENKALAMGLAATKGELSETDKVMARYQLILEQTTLAQGDFERTSDSLTNQSRELEAQIDNLKGEIGQALIPAFTQATTALNDFLDEHSEEIAEGIADGIDAMASAAKGVKGVFDEIAGIGVIKVGIDIIMSDKSTALLAAVAGVAGLKFGGAAGGGILALAGAEAIGTPIGKKIGGEDNPGFLEWVLGGATAPGKLLDLLGGPILDSLRNPGGYSPETIRFFQQHPEQFGPMATNDINKLLRDAQLENLSGLTDEETGGSFGASSGGRRAGPLTPEQEREIARFGRATDDLTRTPDLALLRKQMEEDLANAAKAGRKSVEELTDAEKRIVEVRKETLEQAIEIANDFMHEQIDAYMRGGQAQVEVVREQQEEMYKSARKIAEDLMQTFGVSLPEAMTAALDFVRGEAEELKRQMEEAQQLRMQTIGGVAAAFTDATDPGQIADILNNLNADLEAADAQRLSTTNTQTVVNIYGDTYGLDDFNKRVIDGINQESLTGGSVIRSGAVG